VTGIAVMSKFMAGFSWNKQNSAVPRWSVMIANQRIFNLYQRGSVLIMEAGRGSESGPGF
jgi:hypothetical protein